MSAHPFRYLTAGTAVVVLLAVPLFSIKFGFPSDAAAPAGSTEQQAYDLIATQLGPGANGPLIVVVQVPSSVARDVRRDVAKDSQKIVADAKHLWRVLNHTRGIAHASIPIPNDRLTAAISLVEPTTGPGSEGTAALVGRLRDEVLPHALAHTAFESHAYVGGATATLVDLGDAIQARLPYAIAAVCVAAFLLLLLIFRSLAIPAKAVLMNLLSISAAYGVVVAAFQWGWLVHLFGLGAPIDVVAFVPLLMFALLFGLSMDYELLLLTRIREEYEATGDNRESVAIGLARSGRVITSAALVMITVFLIFTLNANPAIKMLGVGMAAAVLIDATIVRLVLVPATMELLGNANWWLPRWLGTDPPAHRGRPLGAGHGRRGRCRRHVRHPDTGPRTRGRQPGAGAHAVGSRHAGRDGPGRRRAVRGDRADRGAGRGLARDTAQPGRACSSRSDEQDGTVLWRVKPRGVDGGHLDAKYVTHGLVVTEESVCLSGERRYEPGDISVVAFDSRTGKERWRVPDVEVEPGHLRPRRSARTEDVATHPGHEHRSPGCAELLDVESGQDVGPVAGQPVAASGDVLLVVALDAFRAIGEYPRHRDGPRSAHRRTPVDEEPRGQPVLGRRRQLGRRVAAGPIPDPGTELGKLGRASRSSIR